MATQFKVEKVNVWKLPDGTYTESADDARKAIQKMVIHAKLWETIADILSIPDNDASVLSGMLIALVAEKQDEINREVTEAMKI